MTNCHTRPAVKTASLSKPGWFEFVANAGATTHPSSPMGIAAAAHTTRIFLKRYCGISSLCSGRAFMPAVETSRTIMPAQLCRWKEEAIERRGKILPRFRHFDFATWGSKLGVRSIDNEAKPLAVKSLLVLTALMFVSGIAILVIDFFARY